ncbi:MAG: alginate export family protein, partial [Melioribacteraceae bacterium]|nr:alginate export family protein [Melioribacteraceae bacterium]
MKNILLLISVIILTNTAFAQSELDVSAQIRARHQLNNKGFNSDIAGNRFSELRTRLGLKFSPVDNITGFVQLQDSRIYGTEPNTLTGIDNIDLHQAFFSVNNIFDLPVNLKLGRMELSYGPQRLIGAVGFHNVGRSFDGGVLQLITKNIDVDFFTAQTNESFEAGDTNDFSLFGAYGSLKIAKNYKIQPFIIGEMLKGSEISRYTLGLYVNGNIGGLSHEVEGAYQLGSAAKDVDISAYMFALNLKYSFNSTVKPAIGVGVDYLSGDDGQDADKFKVFNTLYATNHKYYGFMDYFLNIPNDTDGLGLMDMHVKAEVSPVNKIKTAIAFHLFNANEDFTLVDGKTSTSFGSEID